MKLKSLFVLSLSVLLLGSCKSYEKVPYFQDLRDGTKVSGLTINNELLRLQPGDKLNIAVSSATTPELAAQYNLPIQAVRVGAVSVTSGSSQSSMPFYVDSKGNIDFPLIGKIRVAGMTREEVEATIKKILVNDDRVKLADAVVTVEVLNQYVNVIGEVARPGRVTIDKDRITILEALSQCGDLTIFGERQNVLVLRTENGVQKAYRVDLSNAQSVYRSPVYQLQQNDVVYVQPNITKQRQSTPWSNSWQNPSIYLSMTSVMVSVAVLISNLVKK